MRLIDADALIEFCAERWIPLNIDAVNMQPTVQPTIYGYNVEHLELIARILQKENMPPERVHEVLTDIGRIAAIISGEFQETLRKSVEQYIGRTAAIISDEFQEALRKSVEQCMYCADAERRTDE